MQDRYAGDIGDYGKIALLKALQVQGLNIGVNWYKTSIQGKKPNSSHLQKDGKYPISEKYFQCDPLLAGTLLDIFYSDTRSIYALEKAHLIPQAIYYSKPVTVADRDVWHKAALDSLKPADMVFVDPDNGMLVKSVGKSSKKSVKYAFYEEICDYIELGQSVLIYNHRSRKPEEEYFRDILEKLQYHTGIEASRILKITFPKCTVRDYLAVPASNKHFKMIYQAFIEMAQGLWGQLGVCRIPELECDQYNKDKE